MNKKVFLIMIMIIVSLFASTFTIAASFSDLPESHWAYQNITTLVDEGVINGYPDGTYRPENPVTRAEFLKLILTALYENTEYFDNSEFKEAHWALPYFISAISHEYIAKDFVEKRADIDKQITRLEMAQILAKICIDKDIGEEKTEEVKFTDVENLENEDKDYIHKVSSIGLINGYPDGTFGGERTMTRAECATIIVRFINGQREGG